MWGPPIMGGPHIIALILRAIAQSHHEYVSRLSIKLPRVCGRGEHRRLILRQAWLRECNLARRMHHSGRPQLIRLQY